MLSSCGLLMLLICKRRRTRTLIAQVAGQNTLGAVDLQEHPIILCWGDDKVNCRLTMWQLGLYILCSRTGVLTYCWNILTCNSVQVYIITCQVKPKFFISISFIFSKYRLCMWILQYQINPILHLPPLANKSGSSDVWFWHNKLCWHWDTKDQ